VIARDGLLADAIDTACFIMGHERCIERLSRLPGPPEAIIVDHDMHVWTTPGIRDRIVWRVELENGRLPGSPEFVPQ